jgi:hypothetical protein
MRKARHIAAVMVVAAALCSDRAVIAPATRPAMGEFARSIATKLTVSFRRVVPIVRVDRESRSDIDRPVASRVVEIEMSAPHRIMLSPFQFRLPPPAIA